MSRNMFRYSFDPSVDIAEIEASLLLALLATESLHGETLVRLEASHTLDAERRICVIDASTEVGGDLNRLFAGFLRREFGERSFTVGRIADPQRGVVAESAA